MKNKKVKSLSIVATAVFLAFYAYANVTYTTGKCCDKGGTNCVTCCIGSNGQSQAGACPTGKAPTGRPIDPNHNYDLKGNSNSTAKPDSVVLAQGDARGGRAEQGKAPALAAAPTKPADVRSLFVYPEGVYSAARIEGIRSQVEAVIRTSAAGSNAPNRGVPQKSGGAEQIGATIREWMRQSGSSGLAVRVTASVSAMKAGSACPPAGCGCTATGGVQCSCALFDDGFCMCKLCPMPPGALLENSILVVVAPPGVSPQTQQNLLEFGTRNLPTMQPAPVAGGLTLKALPVKQ